MGWCCSKFRPRTKERRVTVKEYMTKEEVKKVKETWPEVYQDVDNTGLYLIKRLVEHEQEALDLLLEAKGETSRVLGTRMMDHGAVVLYKLDEGISHLNKPAKLKKIFARLSLLHYEKGVTNDHFQVMWPAMRDTLAMRLGVSYNTRTELAWRNFMQYIIALMRQAPKRELIRRLNESISEDEETVTGQKMSYDVPPGVIDVLESHRQSISSTSRPTSQDKILEPDSLTSSATYKLKTAWSRVTLGIGISRQNSHHAHEIEEKGSDV